VAQLSSRTKIVAIDLRHAHIRVRGLLGGLSAWLGSVPSALGMFAFAELAGSLNEPVSRAALHGLKLVAVAIVAQAVWGDCYGL
jgi:chromate transport protein ChrA